MTEQLLFRASSEKIALIYVGCLPGKYIYHLWYFSCERVISASLAHRSQPCKVDDAGIGVPEQDFNHSSLRCSCCLLLKIFWWWLRTRWGRWYCGRSLLSFLCSESNVWRCISCALYLSCGWFSCRFIELYGLENSKSFCELFFWSSDSLSVYGGGLAVA